MVSFGRPAVWEFPDPETYARARAATGPAYEAIQAIGVGSFIERSAELARGMVREGLLLRGEIQLFGHVGTAR